MDSRREDRTMNRTRRTIGLSALVILVVLGTGWALEKAASSHAQRGTAVIEPATASDAVTTPLSVEPGDVQPAATEPSQEYDRSDLLLSLG